MKRTGFARKVYVPPPSAPLRRVERSGVIARICVDVVPLPKRVAIRSPQLLKNCREIPCQHSGVSDGTVCAAHSNWAEHGKGKSQKADDNRVAALSYAVHSMLDQGSRLTRAERRALWWLAHQRTVRELLRRGLWPADVPVPDIREFNA